MIMKQKATGKPGGSHFSEGYSEGESLTGHGMIHLRLYIASILLVLCMTFAPGKSTGQERVNVTAGMGVPEFLNLGIRYQFFFQNQAGVSIGSFPANDERIISFTGDYYRHFAGLSDFAERKLWYFKGGLSYLRNETNAAIDKFLFANLRIGRDLNISGRLGIELSGGISFQLFHDETLRAPGNRGDFSIVLPVFPNLSMSLFYRIP
jgi:hypothetical protein